MYTKNKNYEKKNICVDLGRSGGIVTTPDAERAEVSPDPGRAKEFSACRLGRATSSLHLRGGQMKSPEGRGRRMIPYSA